ncbi:uncharacterized protein LOC143019433 [Oratosquilla oratoria]|uniref:uncharacterized protein LOC143019433 n=1 Tax=Oratosquilla oratoria TaxID=337810 RepID=UPI003F75F9E2
MEKTQRGGRQLPPPGWGVRSSLPDRVGFWKRESLLWKPLPPGPAERVKVNSANMQNFWLLNCHRFHTCKDFKTRADFDSGGLKMLFDFAKHFGVMSKFSGCRTTPDANTSCTYLPEYFSAPASPPTFTASTPPPLFAPLTVVRSIPSMLFLWTSAETTRNLLAQASQHSALHLDTWILLTPADVTDILYGIDIPVNSKVLWARWVPGSTSRTVLQEIWRPAPSLPLQVSWEAVWKRFRKVKKKKARRRRRRRLSREEGSFVSYVWVLEINPVGQYIRRRNLTGVHFVVTTLNDTRAQNSYWHRDRGAMAVSGFFGDIWELLRAQFNFTSWCIRGREPGPSSSQSMTGPQ